MAKFLIILLIASIIESVGIAILSAGLKQVPGIKEVSAVEIVRMIKAGVTNGKVIFGVALEAVFFGFLLYMLSMRDVSFVWPLTSLGFILTALAGRFLLHENVSALRWTGILLMSLGFAVISFSDAGKNTKSPPPASASASTVLGPQ